MKEKKIPLRKCVGCQQMLDKSTLIRVVKIIDDNNEIKYLIDKKGKMSGRGAYLCKTIQCFEKAQKSRGLERSFKTGLPKEIYENLKSELFLDDRTE